MLRRIVQYCTALGYPVAYATSAVNKQTCSTEPDADLCVHPCKHPVMIAYPLPLHVPAGDATATATKHAAKAATAATDAAAAAATAAAKDASTQQQQEEGVLRAGTTAAAAVRQAAAGAGAGVGVAAAELQETLKEGLGAAREAVDTVAGEEHFECHNCMMVIVGKGGEWKHHLKGLCAAGGAVQGPKKWGWWWGWGWGRHARQWTQWQVGRLQSFEGG